MDPVADVKFKLKIRVPGWARNQVLPGDLYTFADNKVPEVTISLNGEMMDYKLSKGYAVIENTWKKGDKVNIEFKMEVRKIVADDRVEADKGKIAIERGPIVYCAEWPYAKGNKVLNLLFDENENYTASFNDTLFNGVEIITTMAQPARYNEKSSVERGAKQETLLIPYYLWNNKGPGEMTVWLPVSDNTVRPTPLPSIASKSRVTASVPTKALLAVNDQYEPKSSIDRSWPYYHWWPKNNSWQWIQYDFDKMEENLVIQKFIGLMTVHLEVVVFQLIGRFNTK
ncbi:MAG: glycoside hydrolase family 127 protein [Chloroflexia bacterium]|nr:glycoside hydrolase family 127 protein [Chloroflexia bacterium]